MAENVCSFWGTLTESEKERRAAAMVQLEKAFK